MALIHYKLRRIAERYVGDDDVAFFPEYVERRNGLYRCVLCKNHGSSNAWKELTEMARHWNSDERHRATVQRKIAQREVEEEKENEPAPVLYYPSESWDEPVRQGIQVVFDGLNEETLDSDSQDSSLDDMGKDSVDASKNVIWSKRPDNIQGCVYSSSKMDGYYTCIRCNLPDTPQRKYRRCKQAAKEAGPSVAAQAQNNNHLRVRFAEPPLQMQNIPRLYD